eukprot:Protomagalhaensia_wolfi_Nauph_80__5460@NODE_597_length_2230_cov_2601_447741_g98_i4_p2_GENE_NODE_597_length_2230_cov_2601_447741_g98_i4NODE_597_length_2230_cov_2601_447741_g98_i4_p2_ORF_typecomplete_len247_score17_36CLU_N/PF15044_6/0_099TRA1_regulated/PF02343_16/2_5e03TRA1_regulated/PF02343_16/0_26Peptidase_A4/PF01828_17/0_11Arc_trans_TRASH/PF08394_10/1_1e04Arc_trans_TRASH/PF08394_10/0_46Arc_trans_TRASH/PF08394_10/1_1e04_NODE_597_length_2230_cov_2601_447741_g98_i4196936
MYFAANGFLRRCLSFYTILALHCEAQFTGVFDIHSSGACPAPCDHVHDSSLQDVQDCLAELLALTDEDYCEVEITGEAYTLRPVRFHVCSNQNLIATAFPRGFRLLTEGQATITATFDDTTTTTATFADTTTTCSYNFGFVPPESTLPVVTCQQTLWEIAQDMTVTLPTTSTVTFNQGTLVQGVALIPSATCATAFTSIILEVAQDSPFRLVSSYVIGERPTTPSAASRTLLYSSVALPFILCNLS